MTDEKPEPTEITKEEELYFKSITPAGLVDGLIAKGAFKVRENDTN